MTNTRERNDFHTTADRIHIGLEARSLEPAVAFYRALLGEAPVKRRPSYAKFAPEGLALNLSLIETGRASDPRGGPQHFGIQLKSPEAVRSAARRLEAEGLELELEEGVDCCYAVQDKLWVRDPDGNRWELFHTLADGTSLAKRGSACCPDVDVEARAAAADTAGACCPS